MNKYENNPYEREALLAFDKRYLAFREAVLNTKDYGLGKFQEIWEDLENEECRQLLIRFAREEGALPDKLATEYIHLAWSPEEIIRHLGTGAEFYEGVAMIAKEARANGLDLPKEEIDLQVKKSSRELLKEEVEVL